MAPKNKVDRPAAVLAIMIVVSTVIAIFALLLASAAFHADRPGYEGSGGELIQQVSARTPLQPRPIFFNDWDLKRGESFWTASGGIHDGYLVVDPGREPWASLDLREGILEDSEGYRGLEMEVFTIPGKDWKMSVFVFYGEYRNEYYDISPNLEHLGPGMISFDYEYRILVQPEGWVPVRIPLRTNEFGEIRALPLTVYFGSVMIRNVNLVP